MIYQADIREVKKLRSGKPTLVITEPYYEEEFWPLWTELMRFAMRVKTDYLVVFSSYEYEEVHLEYLTATRGLYHKGTLYLAFDDGMGKPVQVFSRKKGGRVIPGMELPGGLWALEQYLPFIMNFTKADDLVCDPFLGSQQAARIMSEYVYRRFEGFDINPGAIDRSINTISP